MINKARPSGASARRAINREQMQTAILDTARSIVAMNGIDGLTMRRVATALDYSPAAIYQYFASKEAILEHLYFAGTSGLAARMERAIRDLPSGANPVARLIAVGWAYRAHALANPDLYQPVFRSIRDARGPPEMDQARPHAGGFGTLVRLASQGVAEGLFVDIPPPLIAYAVWAAVHGCVSLELQGYVAWAATPATPASPAGPSGEQRDQFFEAVIRMMLVGLVTEAYRSTRPDPLTALVQPATSDWTATD